MTGAFDRSVLRVLVVDDSEDDRAEIRSLILRGSDHRYVFEEAETAAAAVRAIAGAPPDCVILDYHLPDADAPGVLGELASSGHVACPVIVLTGIAPREAGREVLRGGAQDFVGKASLTPETLTRAVENAIERFALARQLEARERELRTLADNSPDLLVRFDRDRRHVFVNATFERTFGIPREEALGKTTWELGMPRAISERCEAALREVLASAQPSSFSFAFETATGERHFVTRLVPEPAASGRVEHVLAVTQDVTERDRYEEALRDADRRKDDFLAVLAHELRNPLAPLRTGLSILALPEGRGPAGARAVAMMDRQLGHMIRLIDDLLDVSRIKRGKVELERRRVTVQSVVEQALEAMRARIEDAGHALDVTVPPQPIWVEGDLKRLVQAVGNLLDNAAKYTPRGGHVRVSVAVEGADVAVSVADDGIGIAPENLARVFELFAQPVRAPGRAPGGLGIGLSLVRMLVELHGGSVRAESAGVGRGSTFTICLPRATAREVESAGTYGAPASREEAPLRVLVVDDNEDATELLATMLDLSGNETRIAHDGPEALAAVHEARPDVVFLDLGLPGMDGCEVARRARAEVGDDVMLVGLTGWGSEEDKRRTKSAGFDVHLTKPADFGAVRDVLDLARRRAAGDAAPRATGR